MIIISGMSTAPSLSASVIIYGNLLLLASTFLYLLHLRFLTRTIGIWATSLALAGALALVAGLAVRATETGLTHGLAIVSLTGLSKDLSGVMSLSSAITVIIYLAMERMYRTRSAGAFVMPIVAAAILFVAFGKTKEHMPSENQGSLIQSYWDHAHALTNFIAYGAVAVAAALAVVVLWRLRKSHQISTQPEANPPLLELTKIRNVMNRAMLLGFVLLAISTALDMAAK